MNETGHCEYCQTETPCGHISDEVGEKDLWQHEFSFMGEDLTIGAGIDCGKIDIINFDFNVFDSIRINYCPMCGRKLWHVDDIEEDDN